MSLKRFDMAKSKAERESSRPSGHLDELFLIDALRENRRRRLNIEMVLRHLVARGKKVLNMRFLVLLLISCQRNNVTPLSSLESSSISFYSFSRKHTSQYATEQLALKPTTLSSF